jgi:hypothetical protein
MLALTIQEPFASCVMWTRKRFENRRGQLASWARRLLHEHGSLRLAIHAGVGRSMAPGELLPDGFPWPEIRRGFVLGTVAVVGVHDPGEGPASDWRLPGWHALELADPVWLKEPRRALGQLGLWKLPPAIETAIAEARC